MKGRTPCVIASIVAVLALAAVPAAALGKPGGTDRPLKGSGVATDTVDLATGKGSGQGPAVISHLGKGTFRHSFTIAFTGPSTFTVTGTETLIAANGDEVHATVTGTGTLNGSQGDVEVVITITGGTGRFDDASGTLIGRFSAETVSAVGGTIVNRDAFTLEGRISY